MKKTKILIPALGMMLLSTAAAVSGTMAWFTANRAVQVTTTNFAVQALDGSLDVVALAKVGTTVDDGEGGTNKIVSIASGYKLGDASFNYTNSTLYTDVPEDDGSQPDTYTVVDTLANAASDNTKWSVSTTHYYAIAWDLQFTYTFKSDVRNMDLFFDFAESSCLRNQVSAGTNGKQTANAFRIAFIAGSEKFVWAPFRNATVSEVAQTYTYVNTTSALANYTNGTDLITADYTLAKAEDAAAGHTSRIDYLGTLTNATPGTTNKLTVTCVAWFEGSDPDTLNESAMDQVSNTLKFYVRTAA